MISRLLYTFIFTLVFCSLLNAQTIPVQLNGTAVNIGGDCYRITPDQLTTAGSLWALDSLDLTEDFLVDFSFYLGDDDAGADGIAFLLQPISTSIGTTGGGIGYEGVAPSLGLEFDTWQNIDLNDPTYDHLALQQNGDLDHFGPNNLSSGTVPILDAVTNAEDDTYHNCQVIWDADSMHYSVYVDCELKLEYTGDIVNNIFGGNPFVFYGFTSATGGASNNHEVCINQFGSLTSDTTFLCQGDSLVLTGPSGYVSYLWSPGDLVADSTAIQTIAFPDQTTDFICTAFDVCGNSYVFSSYAEVENCNPCPDAYTLESNAQVCHAESINMFDLIGIEFGGIEIEYDSLNYYVFSNDGVVVQPIMNFFLNTGCSPFSQMIDIEIYCLSDSSLWAVDSFTLSVFPTDLSPFVSPIENDCAVEVDITPGCEDSFTVDSIAAIMPGDSGQYIINVSPSIDNICADSFSVPLSFDCPLCELNEISTTVLDCNGDSYSVEVDLAGEDIGSSFILMDESGNDLGTYNYADLPITVGPFIGDSSSHTITAIDSDNVACSITSDAFAAYCPVCAFFDMTTSVLDCDGGSYSVEVDVSGIDLGSSFTLFDDLGNVLGVYNYSDLPITVGPFPGDGMSQYVFTAVDNDNVGCEVSGQIIGPVACYTCDLANVQYSIICSTEDSVQVTVSFTGSNTYTVSDGSQTLASVAAGDNVFAAYYPENSDVTISITDELADDCSETIEIGGIDCNCASVAGTIMANSLAVCADEVSVIDADDFLLEPGQSVYYLYHDQPMVDASDLPDISTEVYTTGSFFVNDGSTLPCGTTVYVTAIGAMEDLSNPGYPDYNDFCLTVSNTLPILVLCPLVITTDEICDGSSGEITITVEVSGGICAFPAYAGDPINFTGDYYTGIGTINTPIVIGPIADLGAFNLTATDPAGCEASISALFECEKVPVELISFSGEAARDANVLNWQTASEIENDFFILERSEDGVEFSEIARIDGKGTTSSMSSYSYQDENYSKLNYYRLSQVDFDGSLTEEGTIVIERDKKQISDIEIYPRIFEETLQISIESSMEEKIELTLYDAFGRKYDSEIFSLSKGGNLISKSYISLPIGAYFMHLNSKSINITEKIVKR